jgi:tRNA threonylcarbamoyladenosine biosynthesis protein TsaB
MVCLGIDTSTFAIGLGIVKDEQTIYNVYCNTGTPSADRIHTLINRALKESGLSLDDINIFACSIGPGSFTGLRVGIATLEGLSFSLSRPIYGIPTFDSLVWRFLNLYGQIVPILDAKRGEIYTAVYKDGKQIFPVKAVAPYDFLDMIEGDALFLGDGIKIYKDVILNKVGDKAHFLSPNIDSPLGSDVAYLGILSYREGKPPDKTIEPMYIHPPRIRKKSN